MSKYASLHAGLLARKGEASPAIPSSFGSASYVDAPAPAPAARPDAPGGQAERRDIEARSSRSGFSAKHVVDCEPQRETPRPAPTQTPTPTPLHKTAPSGCCNGAAPRDLPEDPHAGIERTGRAEVRLTAEQRRRLRTVAVQMNWPQQRILSDALDAWLDGLCETEMQGCACLRARPE